MVTKFLSLEPVAHGDNVLGDNQMVKNPKFLGGPSKLKIVTIEMIIEKTGLVATGDKHNARERQFPTQAIEKLVSHKDLVVVSGCSKCMNNDEEVFSSLS